MRISPLVPCEIERIDEGSLPKADPTEIEQPSSMKEKTVNKSTGTTTATARSSRDQPKVSEMRVCFAEKSRNELHSSDAESTDASRPRLH
jgi:quercetin dioxygenase-like cupin family protein